MIEIQKETLVTLIVICFLAGVLSTALIALAIMLKGISKRMQNLADRLKGAEG